MKNVKNKKKSKSSKTPTWAWDALAVAVAITLGFGPYVLLSWFGNSVKPIAGNQTTPVSQDRFLASDHAE